MTLALDRSSPRPVAWLVLSTLLLAAGGCGKSDGDKRGAKQAPLVAASPPRPHRFVDRIEAVGTARANEQVTLSSPINERIEHLHFTDGGFVRRGQVVAELAQAEERAMLAGAQADEQQAEAQLRRIQALAGRGFATGTTLDQQIAAARRARSAASNARAQIADRVIRAPFSGYASLRMISEGAIVATGAPIATISDVSRIKLDFTVPETALASIGAGRPIVATAAAYPDRPFRGRIETVDPVIDPATRAASIRAVLPNPDNRLKPGMLLTVSIETAARDGLAVPEAAVVGDGADRYVFVVGANGKAARHRVQVGLRDGGLLEVRGLDARAQVIDEGVIKVTDGAAVRLKKSGPAAS